MMIPERPERDVRVGERQNAGHDRDASYQHEQPPPRRDPLAKGRLTPHDRYLLSSPVRGILPLWQDGYLEAPSLAISAGLLHGEVGMGPSEMDLTTATEEDDSIGGSSLAGAHGPGSPIENPAIERIPDDPLLLPHPGEPGVMADGTAAPLENPDDSVSADPLIGDR